MNQKDSAALQDIKRPAGIIPQVNLRNPLHVGEEAGKSGIHPDFEPKADFSKSPK